MTMMTGNQEWAFRRARERVARDEDGYTIYHHRRNVDDYAVQNAAAAPPRDFVRVATIWPTPKELR